MGGRGAGPIVAMQADETLPLLFPGVSLFRSRPIFPLHQLETPALFLPTPLPPEGLRHLVFFFFFFSISYLARSFANFRVNLFIYMEGAFEVEKKGQIGLG